jgi:hypothetical protein
MIQTLEPCDNHQQHQRIIYRQNVFYQKRVSKNGNIYYRCSKRKKKDGSCPVAITVDASKTTVVRKSKAAHNHPPESASSLEMLVATNRLLLDDSNCTFRELAEKHDVSPSRNLRRRRLRQLKRREDRLSKLQS